MRLHTKGVSVKMGPFETESVWIQEIITDFQSFLAETAITRCLFIGPQILPVFSVFIHPYIA